MVKGLPVRKKFENLNLKIFLSIGRQVCNLGQSNPIKQVIGLRLLEDFLKFNVDGMARSELGPAGIQTFAITKERC